MALMILLLAKKNGWIVPGWMLITARIGVSVYVLAAMLKNISKLLEYNLKGVIR